MTSLDGARCEGRWDHGTISGYKYHGCRCHMCRAASVRYEKGRRWLVQQGLNPTVPAHGFNRRVHALMAIGWTQKEIAAALGIAQGNLAIKLRKNETVRRATHEAMVEVYERWCMTPRRSVVADRNTRLAVAQGWPPPLAWDDIDDPDEQPRGWQYQPSTRFTRAETLAELDHLGTGISTACARLQVSRSALEKWCSRSDRGEVFARMVARETPHHWANQYGQGGVA